MNSAVNRIKFNLLLKKNYNKQRHLWYSEKNVFAEFNFVRIDRSCNHQFIHTRDMNNICTYVGTCKILM